MNITEKDIEKLKNYSKKVIGSRIDIDPDDVVSDTILNILESGKDFSEAYNISKNLIFSEKRKGKNGGFYRDFSESEVTRYCKGCKDDLPANSFSTWRNEKENKEQIGYVCKKCMNDISRGRYKIDITYRERKKKTSNESYQRRKLRKLFASKQYLKNAHAILEWRKSA